MGICQGLFVQTKIRLLIASESEAKGKWKVRTSGRQGGRGISYLIRITAEVSLPILEMPWALLAG
jgi:hypothetical protein